MGCLELLCCVSAGMATKELVFVSLSNKQAE